MLRWSHITQIQSHSEKTNRLTAATTPAPSVMGEQRLTSVHLQVKGQQQTPAPAVDTDVSTVGKGQRSN